MARLARGGRYVVVAAPVEARPKFRVGKAGMPTAVNKKVKLMS
jgi:hypothetical protein